MRQVLQDLATGRTELVEVPVPRVEPGTLLVQSAASLVSSGTENMLRQFGQASLLGKALAQPGRVRQVIEKARTDGWLETLEAVRTRLAEPVPLGYCQTGVVIEVGPDTPGFTVGDRVATNGFHAEMVRVPVNLCARVPDPVKNEEACFAVLGAVALQGVRLLETTLGESVIVTGLGLVGLITAQILVASGCRVLGIEPDPARRALAGTLGIPAIDPRGDVDVLDAARAFAGNAGADGVILATATASAEPVRQAVALCRARGRIVLVGTAGIELDRDALYHKEISFRVSCSYGPGRHDADYIRGRLDYPPGLVRWTAGRNIEAVLDLMARGRLAVEPLITHRIPFEKAQEAYQLLDTPGASLGIVLQYPVPDPAAPRETRSIRIRDLPATRGRDPIIGLVGAGRHARHRLIPALVASGSRLKWVVSRDGVAASVVARRSGFENAGTALRDVLEDPEVDAVVVATPHAMHASMTAEALRRGKHVLVEKPLAVDAAGLAEVAATVREAASSTGPRILTVGFNRRFSPHIVKIRELIAPLKRPRIFVMTVNAGSMPTEHWMMAPEHRGRIVGEACHFIDLLRHLADQPVESWTVVGSPSEDDDSMTATLSFPDGSQGTLHYLAGGHRGFPKERLEVFCQGKVLQLDNFRKLSGWGWKSFRSLNLWRQDKGHQALVDRFLHAVRGGGEWPIPLDELTEVMQITLAMADQLAARKPSLAR